MEILTKIIWNLQDPVKSTEIYEETGNRSLTDSEWSTILHPESDWIVLMRFDDGCARREMFSKNATVRDLLERIAAGPRYGYFEGLVPMESMLDKLVENAEQLLIRDIPPVKRPQEESRVFEMFNTIIESERSSSKIMMDAAMSWIRNDVENMRWAFSDTYLLAWGT